MEWNHYYERSLTIRFISSLLLSAVVLLVMAIFHGNQRFVWYWSYLEKCEVSSYKYACEIMTLKDYIKYLQDEIKSNTRVQRAELKNAQHKSKNEECQREIDCLKNEIDVLKTRCEELALEE